jgi:hypothetical protein
MVGVLVGILVGVLDGLTVGVFVGVSVGVLVGRGVYWSVWLVACLLLYVLASRWLYRLEFGLQQRP